MTFVLPSTGSVLIEIPLIFVGIVWALIPVLLWLSSNYNAIQSLVDGCVERVLRPACLLMSVPWHPKVKPDLVLIEVQHRHISRLLSHTAEPRILSCSSGVYLLQKKRHILASLLCRVSLSNSTGSSCSYLKKPTQAWTSQCQCGHGGMKVSVDPCPYCNIPRCPNCETRRVHGRS
ncbi:uncharacterized protein BKA55DRAFT_7768 [Fusarium redolens]|uniref:Uncharacterized protein n=1 Tax=Fusarium redolens TaxID=48865 RepID=A0A9P9R872_FUSRE|nr:uncharacterized protein BKA55DRAFT_7768 [Fusarium redolens]KAH7269392.1 hypothetical protein BKA55DRAFT_7768 [Fusarium redolens]